MIDVVINGALIEPTQAPTLVVPAEPADGPSLQEALAMSGDALPPDLMHDHGSDAASYHSGDVGTSPLRALKPEEMLLIAGGAGSDISVTGPGWWDPTLPNDPNPDGPYGGGGGHGGGDPPQTNDPYEDRVTIDPSVPADQMVRAHQIEVQMQAQMKDIGDKIHSLPDNALITIGNTTYTGAEIKSNWEHLSFNITWGRDFGPVGSAANTNGVVSLNLDAAEIFVTRYGSSVFWGADDLFLHELAHLFPSDVQFQNDEWISYLNSGGDPNDSSAWQHSSYFQDGERYTNSWAQAIGGRIGVTGYN